MARQTSIFIAYIALMLLVLYAKWDYDKSITDTCYCQEMLLDLVITDTNKIDLKIIDWHKFIDAVMYIESGHKYDAVGLANDVGVLQITPIYVKEVNRILGEQRFTLEDRFDKYKSIQMFEVMNDKYNPERSFYKAMRIHNPKAPESYRKAILNHYYKIR